MYTAIAPVRLQFTYADFRKRVHLLHQVTVSRSGINAAKVVLQDSNHLLETVDEARWETLPTSLRGLFMMILGNASHCDLANQMTTLVVQPLVDKIAWYERQIYAINQYSTFQGANPRLLLPLAQHPLFVRLPHTSLRRAFPLLPLSQQYTARAWDSAVAVLTDCVGERHSGAGSVPIWSADLAKGAATAAAQWDLYPRATRQRLSRAIWNAFVTFLYFNDAEPDLGAIFNEQHPPIQPIIGGASAILNATPPLPLQHGTSPTEEMFWSAILYMLRQAQHAGLLTQEQSKGEVAEYRRRLEHCGGWKLLAENDRLALLCEVEEVMIQITRWKDKMPSSARVFQCIALEPLADLCLGLANYTVVSLVRSHNPPASSELAFHPQHPPAYHAPAHPSSSTQTSSQPYPASSDYRSYESLAQVKKRLGGGRMQEMGGAWGTE